jgi:hypothetical protein
MTIEERLEKLERELSRAKFRNRWLLAGVGLAVGIGLVAWAFGPTAALAQSTRAALTEVRANSFILEDENGKVRAMLITTKDGPRLSLLDENGKPRAGLGVSKDGPSLSLYDENGKDRAGMAMTKDGPKLGLFDENGVRRTMLGAASTVTPEGKTITYPESSLLLFSPDGKTIWSAP